MANISDVAKLAGLSVSTVSRVINNEKYVKEEKRQAVLTAMKELNYSPSITARQMRGKAGNRVGVIIPRITNPFFSYLVDSIEKNATARGYETIILQTSKQKEKEASFVDMLHKKQLDGLILSTVEDKELIVKELKNDLPIVLCDEAMPDLNIPSVHVDQERAAYLGVRHLIQRGYQRIAFCSGRKELTSKDEDERFAGYLKAIEEAGLPFEKKYLFTERHTIEDGKKLLQDLIMLGNKMPDAVFTGGDEVAAGLLYECRKQEIAVPKQLAILGFDDQPMAELLYPSLSTIHQPITEMGKTAINWMIAILEGKNISESQVLDATLIKREST